jgi:hypothetical protein
MKKSVLVLIVVLFLELIHTTAGTAEFFGVNMGISNLYRIDINTRIATLIGPTGLANLIGLAVDTDGTIYTINESSNAQLWKLNATTGAAKLVGSTGLQIQEGDMTIDPRTGTLYVAIGSPDRIYTVDKRTGTANLFANTERDVSGLTFVGNTLYGLALRDWEPDLLVQIDTSTRAAKIIGETGTNFGVFAAMAYDPVSGMVYIAGPSTKWGNDNKLYKVNLETGAASLIGDLIGLNSSISGFSWSLLTTVINIDISPNNINPKSKGKISVAILSAKNLDAPSQIDPNSLTFGRSGDEQSLAFCHGSEDVNKDGLQDLICLFYSQDTGFQCGDIKGILKGKTVKGKQIEGRHSVKIVPCK